MKTLMIILLGSWIAGSIVFGAPLHMEEHYQWGPETNGLRMAIATVDSQYRNNEEEIEEPVLGGSNREFRVAIQNVGKSDVVVDLGVAMMTRQYSSAVVLVFTDKHGIPSQLESNLDHRPGIAGRVDRLLVPLPDGSTYIIRVGFDRFSFSGAKPRPGEYQVKAILQTKPPPPPIDPGVRYWIGTVESRSITFTLKD